ncbi:MULTISPECIES: polyprenyl synthetase family protein [unclassified Streptomyces]|uniref:polyprenyl synthetase family protein n=1 Tax=unclassified Streptomyces TaxID=2593676 RepID=UPI00211C9B6A|nr:MULTISPECIES: polyprenyl synthetase family protein [unclassified Streptomyces]
MDNCSIRSGVAPPVSKGVRPALALLACRAVGADPYFARAAAVAVALVRNASLLHDDVIDQDPLRRGRPALWAAKGMPTAILAGDALFFAAVQTLAEAPDAGRTVPVLPSCGVLGGA